MHGGHEEFKECKGCYFRVSPSAFASLRRTSSIFDFLCVLRAPQTENESLAFIKPDQEIRPYVHHTFYMHPGLVRLDN